MRKIVGLFTIILIVSILSACDVSSLEISENITAPKNRDLPIYGEWLIEDYKLTTISTMTEDEAKNYIGAKVIFHDKLVYVGDSYFLNPTFKLKNVNAKDYLT